MRLSGLPACHACPHRLLRIGALSNQDLHKPCRTRITVGLDSDVAAVLECRLAIEVLLELGPPLALFGPVTVRLGCFLGFEPHQSEDVTLRGDAACRTEVALGARFKILYPLVE